MIKILKIICAAIALPALLTAQDTLKLIDAVAAEVGGRRITVAEVMEGANAILSTGETPVSQADLMSKFTSAYGEALTNLINKQLILLRYEQAPRKLPDWVINRRVDAVVEEHFGGDRSQLVSMLSKHGITYAKWRKNIEEETIINTMRQQFVDAGITVKPEDIRAFYEAEYAGRKLPGHVRVAMILLRPAADQFTDEAMASAKDLCAKIRAGQDFAATARKLSVEDHASKGGDWGYIEPADELRKELADALAALKPGEVSDPVLITPDYIYILKKVDESKDLSIPFDSVREEIEKRLRAKAGGERFDAWIDSLRKTTTVRVLKPTP